MRYFLAAAALLLPATALASGKPLSIAVKCGSAIEGQSIPCVISQSGGNGRTTVSVSWEAVGLAFQSGVVKVAPRYPLTVQLQTTDDTTVNGTRMVTVNAAVISGTSRPTTSGTAMILDNDVAVPAPVPTPTPVPATGGMLVLGTVTATQPCPSLWGGGTLVVGRSYPLIGRGAGYTDLMDEGSKVPGSEWDEVFDAAAMKIVAVPVVGCIQ